MKKRPSDGTVALGGRDGTLGLVSVTIDCSAGVEVGTFIISSKGTNTAVGSSMPYLRVKV